MNSKVFARKDQEFIETEEKKINFISTSSNQIISIGTGLIPFLEHNDANRALMGSNMQRQAVTLIRKQRPIVQTGLEKQVGKDSQSTLSAKKSGKVKYVSIKKIIVEETSTILLKRKANESLLVKLINNLSSSKKKHFKIGKRKTYSLELLKKSNQNTIMYQQPIIKEKQWIKKGQLIVDGAGTYEGKLSLGRNLLIGYIGWEGYNFEDAVVINEKLIKEDLLTSMNIKKFKTFLISNEVGEVRNEHYR